mgnify:CR=1 FL=1
MLEVIKKIKMGYAYAKDTLGFYLLTVQDIKQALAASGEVIVEDRDGNILGYLFLDQDFKISFIPYTHHTSYHTSYIES